MATRGLHWGSTKQDEPARPAPDQATSPTPDQAAGSSPLPTPMSRPPLVATGLGLRPLGTGSPWRWFFSAIWLVYLIQPASALFGHGHGALWIAGGLAITAAFVILYVPVLVNMADHPRRARAGLAALAALAALAVAIGYRYAPDQVQPISILLYFVFAILGGLWFPLTGFLGDIGQLTPTYDAVKIASDVIGNAGVSVGLAIGLVVWLAIFVALATLAVRATAESV